jgi:hypothetical protein
MAFDVCHEQIVRALEKAGWRLESTPFKLAFEARTVYVDVQMSRGVDGSREQIVLVEVKCFPDEHSTTRDLYTAIGQYLVYRAMLMELGMPYVLYLAVPDNSFEVVFDAIVMRVIEETQIKIVVVNVNTEQVVRWIES